MFTKVKFNDFEAINRYLNDVNNVLITQLAKKTKKIFLELYSKFNAF